MAPLWRKAFDAIERPLAAGSETWIQSETFMDLATHSFRIQRRTSQTQQRQDLIAQLQHFVVVNLVHFGFDGARGTSQHIPEIERRRCISRVDFHVEPFGLSNVAHDVLLFQAVAGLSVDPG